MNFLLGESLVIECVLILMAYFTALRGVGNISSEYRLVSIRWCNDSMM